MVKYHSALFTANRIGSHKWDGNTWTYYPTIYVDSPLSIQVYNDTLYLTGDFSSGSQQTSRVVKFDGANWLSVGGGFNHPFVYPWNSYIKTSVVYNNKLYIGGQFTDNDGVPMKNISCYNGIKWDSVGRGLNGAVTYLATHNGSLIAAGGFTASGNDISIKYIASWNGSTWNPVSAGYTFKTGNGPNVSYDNKLIIGNIWDTINNIPMKGIAAYDGVNFVSLGNPSLTYVSSFWVFNNQLFLSGDIGNVKAVLVWNGMNWQQVGGIFNDDVWSLEDYNGELIAGGRFSSCDGTSMNRMARTSVPVSINEYPKNLSNVNLFPNPATHKLFLEFESEPAETISIINTLGQIVYTLQNPEQKEEIDITHLKQGFYFIIVQDKNSNRTFKLMKE